MAYQSNLSAALTYATMSARHIEVAEIRPDPATAMNSYCCECESTTNVRATAAGWEWHVNTKYYGQANAAP